MVAALFVVLGFASGFGFYNQSVLLEALTSQRGFSVATASLASTAFFAVGGLVGLLVAGLIERFDARFSLTAGAVLSAISLALVGQVEQSWQLLAVFTLFGCGFAGISMVTATTLITRWFVRRRSLALAIASTGLSVGGIVLTPLSARAVARFGLADAGPLLAGGLLLGIVPIGLLWLRDRPQDLGQEPDGGLGGPELGADWAPAEAVESEAVAPTRPPTKAAREVDDVDIDLGQAVRSRFFYGLVATFFFGLAAQVGGIAHQFKLVSGVAGAEVATLAVSVLAGSSVLGRLAAGWVASRTSLRGLTGFLVVAQGATLFFFGRADSATEALVASGAFGLTVGSFLLTWPLLIAYAFGVRSYARIYSIVGVAVTFGIAAGPAAIGILYSVTGGYPSAFAAASGVSGIAALSLWLAGPARPVVARG